MPTTKPANAETPLVLTIDAGTSSARALVFDVRGRMVDGIGAHERYEIHTSPEGASEDDPDAAIERIARCIDTVLEQAGSLAGAIRAVAIDTLVSNILAIDANGRPITSLVTYADTRNASDAAAVRKKLDEREAHDRTGCLLRTAYWPARLAWFRRTQPEVWRTAARWITLGEYLELRLFGQCRASLSVASWSGLLDRRTLVWDTQMLEGIDLAPDKLSPLVDVDAPLSGLRAPFAARWPALREVPWFPAIGDGAAANVGSGCLGPSRIALTIGTSGAMRVVLDDSRATETRRHGDTETSKNTRSLSPSLPVSVSSRRVPDGLWCYRVDRRRALLGGATSEGGNVYAWMRENMRLGEPEQIEQALVKLPPDGHGLTILPFLAGERSPGWAGDVRATISGIGLGTTPIEILRASLEAIAYRFALIFERLETGDLGPGEHSQSSASGIQPPAASFIASGGALLESPAWMQIMADVLGRPVVASAEPEATSRGVALLALAALGAVDSPASLPADDGATSQPDAERHARYRAAVERQRALYAALIEPSAP